MENLAITGANRYSSGIMDRTYFEFTNFSNNDAKLNATIKAGDSSKIYEKIDTVLAPGEIKRVVLNVYEQHLPVNAEINSDDFAYDNKITLNSVKRDKIRTSIIVKDNTLKRLLTHTLNSVGNVLFDDNKPELIISEEEVKESDCWNFIIHKASESYLLDETVALDLEHPLCVGLPPVRTVWAADMNYIATGSVLMASGNNGLLFISDDGKNQNGRITLNYDYEFSDLHSTSFWPVLFWNLINMCQERLRPIETNIILLKSESDFRNLSLNNLPDITKSQSVEKNFINVKWWFLITALALLAVHQWMITKWRTGFVY